MKKIVALVIVFIFLAIPVFADDWTREDTYRELGWTALLVVDYGQTMNIAQNPDKFREHNPILDKHPSKDAVRIYMLSAAIIHPVISYYLPPKYRKWWQYISIGVEIGAVGNNFGTGIGVTF